MRLSSLWRRRVSINEMEVVVEQCAGHHDELPVVLYLCEVRKSPRIRPVLWNHLDYDPLKIRVVRIVRDGNMEVVVRLALEIAIHGFTRIRMGHSHEIAHYRNDIALRYLAVPSRETCQFCPGVCGQLLVFSDQVVRL